VAGPHTHWQVAEIRGDLEILSLSGTLSSDEAHLHIAVATSAPARCCALPLSWRSRLCQICDRPQRGKQIRQSLLAGLIRWQERSKGLKEGGGVQQLVELGRRNEPAVCWACPRVPNPGDPMSRPIKRGGICGLNAPVSRPWVRGWE